MSSHSPTAASSPLASAIKRYLAFLQSEENKSVLTVTNYRQSLDLLLTLSPVSDAAKFSKESVRTCKQRLHEFRTKQGKELALRTKNHHLTILRAFLRYLLQEEELNVYPPDRIKRFKEEQRKVKVLSKEELDRLLAAPDRSKREGKRDRAILELFFSTGLRLAELRSLNRKDLNFNTREISVRGKRNKLRVVFLSDAAVVSLTEYLDARLDHLHPLFIRNLQKATHELPPGENFRLSRISIYGIVKKYARAAGIVTDPSPHTLRHSFATDLLRSGADLRSVQELLGHKDLSTTQIYTHVTNPQLKEVHRKFHGRSM
ncbi:tyrosine-type recombinase/integrase [Candidatus Peregrinibacteria bacterium]|nr:tyrosine-type recombinase/integrase [Candidatus Peregrinibacteria bacterium]MBI3816750.1 tyrosine-type recombinase/integrase [Candidatus Peregrinibacteria bacterium]